MGRAYRSFVSATSVAMLLIGTATRCSDSSGSGPSGTATTNAYMDSLPPWDQFSPLLPDTNDIVGPSMETTEIVDGAQYACTTSPYTITHTPDKIVTMDPDVNILWLGALLQGRGYKNGIGSLQEWPVRERAPLQVSIDLLNGTSATTVVDPNLASVNQAIGAMVEAATAAGHRGGSSVSYSMQKSYSAFQAGASLGLSTMYFGPTISASISASRNAKETTVTAYFVQRMFTASIVLPNTPSDFFSDAFTPARLQEERDRGRIGSDNIPVYVANIVYGRSLLFSFTSSTSADSIRAALSVSVGTDSVGASGRLLNILQTSRIGIVALGGEARNATELIQSGRLADYFEQDAALTSARPISYTIRNLGDNSIAKVSETTNYDLKECAAIPTTGRANVDVTPNDAAVSVLGPGGYSFGPRTGDQLLTELVPGGYTITVTRTGYDTSSVDISIAAGDALDVPVTLKALNQTATGVIFDIVARRMFVDATGCSGESRPDIYHSTTVNGKQLTDRPRTSSIPLYAGEWDDPSKGASFWGQVRDTVWFTGSRTRLAFHMEMWDNDGALNPPDPMAASNWAYTAPNIPISSGIIRNTGGYSGCATRFSFDINKVADIFSPAP